MADPQTPRSARAPTPAQRSYVEYAAINGPIKSWLLRANELCLLNCESEGWLRRVEVQAGAEWHITDKGRAMLAAAP